MTVQDPEGRPPLRVTERVVEGLILAVIAVLAAVLGLPSLVEMVREGDADLAAVFYPVLLVSAVVLAWTRRS